MTTHEFEKLAMADILEVAKASTWERTGELVEIKTNRLAAVLRFRIDEKNHCVVATKGFCNAMNPKLMQLFLADVELPECLPNGAEVPLWLTQHDVPDWINGHHLHNA